MKNKALWQSLEASLLDGCVFFTVASIWSKSLHHEADFGLLIMGGSAIVLVRWFVHYDELEREEQVNTTDG
jgi:hypothetical protein